MLGFLLDFSDRKVEIACMRTWMEKKSTKENCWVPLEGAFLICTRKEARRTPRKVKRIKTNVKVFTCEGAGKQLLHR